MKTKQYIAYQTVDSENDIWCNTALLFESKEDVFTFFNNPKNVIDTLKIELYEDETIESIDYKTNGNNEVIPRYITFECEYAGKVVIKEMSKGFLVTQKQD